MEYNITFSLGEYDRAHTYHMVVNHSVEEITEAYKKTTELLGFDFVKNVGVYSDSYYWISKEYTEKLLELGIITDEYVSKEDCPYCAPIGCYEFNDTLDEFIEIVFSIVKYFLPDFKYRERDLKEDRLYLLQGAANGFI